MRAFTDQQFEKLMSEKEEAIQDLERKHKRKLVDAETKLRYNIILENPSIFGFAHSIVKKTCYIYKIPFDVKYFFLFF